MKKDAKYQNVLNDIQYYEKIGYLNTALEICNKAEYKDSAAIQYEKLIILFKIKKEYEDAYRVFRLVKKMKDPDIQSIGIQILSKLGQHDELEKLITENGNIESNYYKHTLIDYYTNRREYDKALDICNEPFCASQEVFQKLKRHVKNLKYRTREGLVYEFLMRIYADDITLDEIKKANIKENIDPNASDIDKKKARIMEYFKKDVLVIAYYEKYNRKQAIEECKRSKKNNNYDKEQLKSLNIILNHLMSKKNKMDYDLYKYILGVSFDWEEVHKYMEAKKEQEEYQELMNSIIKKVKEEEKPSIKIDNIADSKLIEKPKKIERKIVGVTGVNVNSRHSSNNINIPILKPQKNTPKIKDVLGDEIISLQKYIYCMMQDPSHYTDANNAWLEIKDIAYKKLGKWTKYNSTLTSNKKDNKSVDDKKKSKEEIKKEEEEKKKLEAEKFQNGFNRMKEAYAYYDKAIEVWDNIDLLVNKPITDTVAVNKLTSILSSIRREHPEILEVDTNKLIKVLNK